MTSRNKKVMGAQMSGVTNNVKDEFKQFLPSSNGPRPRGGGANLILAASTSKQTYKAKRMSPYLFMGLQQMRTCLLYTSPSQRDS